MKQLSQLLLEHHYIAEYDKADYPNGIGSVLVGEICNDSRVAKEGAVFVCIRGEMSDGHDYYRQAYESGCRIFVCEKRLPFLIGLIQIIVPNTRIALAEIAEWFYDHPEKELKVIGITGTKGKSTVAYMLSHILNRNNRPTGTVGTCGTVISNVTTPTQNTTPESLELIKILRKMKDAGCEYAVIEVSSQAVLMNRIHGIRFFAAALTNLSPDHIGKGEHPDFENYKDCKKRLFSLCDIAVLNRDDKFYEEFKSACISTHVEYSLDDAKNISQSEYALHTEFEYAGIRFDIPLPGAFNVMNALCAVKLAGICGIGEKLCAAVLKDVSVPGRFEEVKNSTGARFIIDYAHNGESLRSAINALRSSLPDRLICLFGSVGGRTQLRRAELGKAARAADFCIITSDNPDSEPPENIIADIVSNIGETPYITFIDRAQAIKYAVKTAKKGDIVLLAGKGHEQYQLINGKKIPFSEKELIKKYSDELIKA